MSHENTTTLLRLGYYMAFAVWVLLTLLLVTGIFRKRWAMVKRVSKYLVNSSVFLIAFVFYLDMALIVRPPVSEPQLKSWVNQHVVIYLCISVVATIILVGINFLFYKKVEKHRHRADLFILAGLDIIILLCG